MKQVFPDNRVVIMDTMSSESTIGSITHSDSASLLIMGDIGGWWGVNSDEVYRELQGKDVSNINVFISSPGGSVKDAFTIYNFLKGHKANVTAYLFGECMSAASVIANAANKVVIGAATVYMAHHGAVETRGKAKDLRKTASMIDTYDSIIEDTYVSKTGLSKEVIHNLLDEENYITPKDALELGLVDEVIDAISVDFKVNESHPNFNSDEWMDWVGYWKSDKESNLSCNNKSLDIKYMSSSKVKKIKNLNENNDNMFDKILAKLDAIGAKITNKDGSDIDASKIFNKEDFKDITNSVFADQKQVLVNDIKKSFKSDIDAINAKIDALDISASINKVVEPLNAKIEKLEVNNKSLVDQLEARKQANKAAAAEATKTPTKPTNSEKANIEVREVQGSTKVKFTRLDNPKK